MNKYINSVIDTVKVAHFYLEIFVKSNPWVGLVGVGANVADLGKAVYDIEKKIDEKQPIELGQVITLTTSIGDLLADFALASGARTLQPQVVMAGLLIKGATTGLSYLSLVYGDTPLFPGQTVQTNNNSTVGSDGEVLVIGQKPLDIYDKNGQPLVSIQSGSNGGFAGLTVYQKDLQGNPVAVDLEVGVTKDGLQKLTAELTNQKGEALGSMTQEATASGGTRLEFLDADRNPVQTSVRVNQTVNGQSVQVTETVNHLAKGTEIASSKVLETAGGARIENNLRADGHLDEITSTKDPETGVFVKQSSKVLSYSQAERDVAASDVALAGLELMQALRSGNKLQAAGSLIRLVNQAQVASNTQPVLGAIGTGFSGAVSILSALDSWGDASDGERIALTARAVLGANEVAKAFSADGNTGFLQNSAALGALQGVVALASLDDVLESGNPFAIASTFMSIANAGGIRTHQLVGAINQDIAKNPVIYSERSSPTVTLSADAIFSILSKEMLRTFRSTCAMNVRCKFAWQARSSCDQFKPLRKRMMFRARTSRAPAVC